MLKKIRSVAIYVVYSLFTTMATDALAIETGLASYYSDRFQGRKTASGQHYDRNKLTAAHRTLPIGSQIEVTNLKNQSSVIVTINDRGPYAGNRKLDLSYAAAKELGLVASGVARVSFDVLTPQKDNDFEKVIPLEYSADALEVAKSEEEVIEAEEELANSDSAVDTSVTVKAEKSSKHSHSHKHKAKKVADNSEKTTNTSKTKHHAVDKAEKKSEKTEKSTKSAKNHHKQTSKVTKVARSSTKKSKKA